MDKNALLIAIDHIPASFHATDLRHFFADAIRGEVFQCFHFLHRHVLPWGQEANSNKSTSKSNMCCAIAAVSTSSKHMKWLVDTYDGRVWFGNGTEPLLTHERCALRELQSPQKAFASAAKPKEYLTRKQKRQLRLEHSIDPWLLPDLNPPPGLELGNVGTPLPALQQSVARGVLPKHVFAHLTRTLAPQHKQQIAANSPVANTPARFLYTQNIEENMVGTHRTHTHTHTNSSSSSSDCEGDDLPVEEEDDLAITYGREERLHYLFEEDMEVVWEKGGSGLVFHTDDVWWEQQRGDQDEQWADGFEVDGFDALAPTSEDLQRPWISRPAQRMMQSMGWQEGHGLGKNKHGRKNPIVPTQRMRRRGIGFECSKSDSQRFQHRSDQAEDESLGLAEHSVDFAKLVPKAQSDGAFTLADEVQLQHILELQDKHDSQRKRQRIAQRHVGFVLGSVASKMDA